MIIAMTVQAKIQARASILMCQSFLSEIVFPDIAHTADSMTPDSMRTDPIKAVHPASAPATKRKPTKKRDASRHRKKNCKIWNSMKQTNSNVPTQVGSLLLLRMEITITSICSPKRTAKAM